ncbi:MAG: hypothetical protein A3G80_06260 [Betaproteobacteria bacterium RIFCSPLOWO2_12_FULL_62_13b]|nr:MAG: hypothetical protein A3G80_06260 [Betaproteobacteria bacterium RIFCSPLOWO2_12_FULL_62_13b]
MTGSQKHRDSGFRPWVFTEHNAIMAATVLNSQAAIAMSDYIVRAFKHRLVAAAGFEDWSGSHTDSNSYRFEPSPVLGLGRNLSVAITSPHLVPAHRAKRCGQRAEC